MNPWEDIHRFVLEQGQEIDWGAALTDGVMGYLIHCHNLLDLGCGSGNDAIRLAQKGIRVMGLDISISAVNRAQDRADAEDLNAQFIQADMSQGLTFRSERFDGVLANLSLHYFPWEQTRYIVSEVRRVLRPGGVFVLHVNSEQEGHKRKAKGVAMTQLEPGFYREDDGITRRYFSEDDLEDLLEGWRIEVLELLRIENAKGKPKYCWRAVVKDNDRG
jgi:ubiquinone/menaquinone biosynthesis C-methylase UbiE